MTVDGKSINLSIAATTFWPSNSDNFPSILKDSNICQSDDVKLGVTSLSGARLRGRGMAAIAGVILKVY